MGLIFERDNNPTLPNGSPNPNFGHLVKTKADASEAPLDATQQRLAMVRGRAALLDKKGKYSEASALRAMIGE